VVDLELHQPAVIGAALLAAVVSAARPTAAVGQAAAPVWPSLQYARDTSTPPRIFVAGQGTLPCPDCNPPKRFWAAAGEWTAVQVIPWAFTRFIRNGEWSHLSIDSWLTNLKFSWQWDNNDFTNNQFSHPYHGAMYFNAARTNGYNFWESAPWAFGGSLIWELFGEVWAPAPNDLANTTLGGITLGEIMFRFSSLVLNNRATGSNRVVREVAGTLINPVRGFNRLVRGEMSQVSETPPDWRPTFIQGSMDIGYRRLSSSPSLGGPTASSTAIPSPIFERLPSRPSKEWERSRASRRRAGRFRTSAFAEASGQSPWGIPIAAIRC
jgi:hypothetical protein